MMNPLSWLGDKIARYLQKPSTSGSHPATCSFDDLISTIRKGDVLLIDGVSRVSTAIKYLTQSTWSHATLCISDQTGEISPDPEKILLIEADVVEGVRIVSIDHYKSQHTRICRPAGLDISKIDQAIEFVKDRLGHQYDKKNVIDLMRYIIQTPPIPVGWRRSALRLGSGDPTRAICSSLIAQTFQSIGYPILPDQVERELTTNKLSKFTQVFMRTRHHTLFVPRDFDISPYFLIIKPSIENGFDPNEIQWHQPDEAIGVEAQDSN